MPFVGNPTQQLYRTLSPIQKHHPFTQKENRIFKRSQIFLKKFLCSDKCVCRIVSYLSEELHSVSNSCDGFTGIRISATCYGIPNRGDRREEESARECVGVLRCVAGKLGVQGFKWRDRREAPGDSGRRVYDWIHDMGQCHWWRKLRNFHGDDYDLSGGLTDCSLEDKMTNGREEMKRK